MAAEIRQIQGNGMIGIEGHGIIILKHSIERIALFLSMVIALATVFSMWIMVLGMQWCSLQQIVGVISIIVFAVIVIWFGKKWFATWVWKVQSS